MTEDGCLNDQAFCKRLIAEGRKGAIVNIGSIQAARVLPGRTHYAPSKLAIEALTRNISAEVGSYGIRVNCIHPGLIDTPIYGEGEASEQFKERLAAGVLFPKRLGRADEFATLAGELLRNSYMNAESIRIDAGIRMQPK